MRTTQTIEHPEQLVLGLGEVGAMLRELFRCDGYDPLYTALPDATYDVLHVIFPYSASFVDEVEAARARYRPSLILIHSTVPIGTTAKIPGAVHSPVNGRRDGMAEDLRRFTKWVGGPEAARAAAMLEQTAGLRTHCVPDAAITEALKLLCLARYGVDIAFSHYAQEVLTKVGGSVDDFLAWTRTYNAHVRPERVRPLIAPDGPVIGGHCVVPVTELLHADFPSPLLAEVLRWAT